MKRAFPIEVIASLTTGKLLCGFGDMHELAEFVAGHPIWTHEFACRETNQRLADTVFAQHPSVRDIDASWVTRENWRAFVEELRRKFPVPLEITKGDEARTEGPVESFQRIAPGKPVVAVITPNVEAN